MLKTFEKFLETGVCTAVLGSGAREHAIAAKIAESPYCKEVYVLPGNDGVKMALTPKIKTHACDLKDFEDVAKKLRDLEVDFVVVGPDDLLAAGIVDFLDRDEQGEFVVFGPKKAAAKLEWSKAFAKEVMEATGVPTAKSVQLTATDASAFAEKVQPLQPYPIVLKYDGLALGKGVLIAENEQAANDFLKEVFEKKKFERSQTTPSADATVLAEQYLRGFEVSLFAICDGSEYVLLEPACDHKRLLTGNRGPNTGGMGAYSPVPWLQEEQLREMGERIFKPILAEMKRRKASFRGLLYAGLMVSGKDFHVLEFNARFGDPETQAVLPRLKSDLLLVLYGAAQGQLVKALDMAPLRWRQEACVNIVAASRGYPEKPETGFEIQLGGVKTSETTRLFFAGVKSKEGHLVSAGGRVLGISQLAPTVETALDQALGVLSHITFDGMYYRTDIGRIGED